MDRRAKSYLFDILTCIEEIEDFFEHRQVTLEELTKDKKTMRAVERELEIIGEATKKLLKVAPETQITESRKIIGARNFIAHEYQGVSYQLIVDVINLDFPKLKQEVKQLLGEK